MLANALRSRREHLADLWVPRRVHFEWEPLFRDDVVEHDCEHADDVVHGERRLIDDTYRDHATTKAKPSAKEGGRWGDAALVRERPLDSHAATRSAHFAALSLMLIRVKGRSRHPRKAALQAADTSYEASP